jgi:hypothetical protein
MKSIALVFALFCAGCVSVPIPPFGNEQQRGSLGDLKISVQVSYIPKSSPEKEPTDSAKFAWEQFKLTKPKLLKDK